MKQRPVLPETFTESVPSGAQSQEIVCTLGPVLSTREGIRAFVDADMDVARRT